MKAFSGFPAGKVKFTPLPNLFFSQLLPAIDDLAELKVTLHTFWLLHQKKGYPRFLSLSELLGDGTLLTSLRGLIDQTPAQTPEGALRQALERAVARGTLLRIVTEADGKREEFYFLNNPEGRRTVERIKRGELKLKGEVVEEGHAEEERPNIFVLYEQNIGLLTPLIAEELKDAEKAYPDDWIEEAFRIAVENNVRRWRYVRRILERWATEGKDSGREKKGRRWYTEEEHKKFIKH